MPPSRLTTAQRAAVRVIVVVGGFMLADTGYLLLNRLADVGSIRYFAATPLSLPIFYQIMMLAHTGIGLILAAAAVGFVLWHLPSVWRRTRHRAIYTGLLALTAGLALAATGLLIVTAASTREHGWAYWVHVVAAAALPLMYLLHRRASLWKPTRPSYWAVPLGIVVALVVMVIAHGVLYDPRTDVASRTLAGAQQAATPTATSAPSSDSSTNRGAGRGAESAAIRAPAPRRPGPVPASFVSPQSPFFPAATTTSSGTYMSAAVVTGGDLPDASVLESDLEQHGFLVNDTVGAATCARCHAGIAQQWMTSAHRFASFNNPFYEASINDMRTRATATNPELEQHLAYFPELAGLEAQTKSRFCSGCHDPALMLAGRMTSPVDRSAPEAQAGLTCLACHAIDRVHGATGNGNYNIADQLHDPYLFAGAPSGVGQFLHDTALKARPAVHQRQMLKPLFRTAEYCASCHKVSLDTRVNGYRWLRGQDEYDAWHDSGVAQNAARTFYLPGASRSCQDCHMPYEPVSRPDAAAVHGLVRSHRFLAANTALPFVRGDLATVQATEHFLRNDKLRVDIISVGPADSAQPSATSAGAVPVDSGQRLAIEVVVRNLGVGHTFPGGTNDSNEAWLELTAVAANSGLLAISGAMGTDHQVSAAAHFYRAVLVDGHGAAIHRRNAHDAVAPVYVRTIGPGAADVAHYDLLLPSLPAGERVQVRARLLWRKFERRFTEFAYRSNPEGFRAFDDVPDLPVTEIAADSVTLLISPPVPAAQDPEPDTPRRTAPALAADAGDHAQGSGALGIRAHSSGPADGAGRVHPPSGPAARPQHVAGRVALWERWNDYGIGLLLQGDTRGAAAAFQQVAELAPERLDGPRNLARTALRDGNLAMAYRYLQACEALAPGHGQTAWVWGRALQEEGRYEDAALAYERVLDDFPRDRDTWLRLGRTLYLDGRFSGALEALDQVLAIDPEDRSAHYHRMLTLRSMDRQADAAISEQEYRYYQIDDSAQEVTRGYRLAHPHDHREALAVHRHALSPPSHVQP
jgi:tetratricopeptide (TPR) repeat protein